MRPSIIRDSSSWPAEQIEAFLQGAVIPIRLACSDADGTPLISSLWFLLKDEQLWCATQASSLVASLLARDGRCGFEIAGDQPPYRGVRGQGQATLLPDLELRVLGELVDRYVGNRDTKFARWLLSRREPELAIRIEPEWITSWDFTARMSPKSR